MKLGDWVKEYRKAHGMSMQVMADRCGFSKAYIGMLEKGINPKTKKPLSPTIQTFEKIAHGTGLDVNDLMKRLDEDQPVTIPAAPTPQQDDEPPISQKAARVARAYDKADDRSQVIVDTTLEPWMEQGQDDPERAALNETAARIGKKILSASPDAQLAVNQIIRDDDQT